MADRRARIAASVLALLTAVSVWLSAGIILGGDTESGVAALPSLSVLAFLAVALPAAVWLAKLRLEQIWPLAVSLVLWLPYLPFHVGARFLLWEGPIEGIVWLVVVAGLIAARPPQAPSALTSPTTAPWIAATLVAVSALIVFSQVRNVVPGGDEPHYLAATQSLIQDADLKVANNYARGDYLTYFPGQLEPHFLKRSTAGEIYSIHAPGVSVIVLPAFAIAGYTGAVWTMVFFAALAAALMWRLALTVSQSPAAAWIAVGGVCFSAPFFFHAFTIYPEIIGAFCVLAGVWLLVELAEGRDPSSRALIAASVALAMLPWLHSRFAVLAASLGLLIAARLATRTAAARRIAVFLAVPTVAALAWFAFFYVIWGSPNPTAPYGPDTSTSASYVLRGVIGLLFDQQFGFVTTAPIYAMAMVGAVALFRSRPRLAIELALIVIPYAVAVASYAMWWGGSAAPARFLVAVLPLAVLPIASGYVTSATIRACSLILVVVSAALILPRAFEDSGRFIYNNRSGVDATVRWLSSNVDLPSALPSVHRTGGHAALRTALHWLASLVVAATLVAALARRWSVGARMALAGWLLVFACLMSAVDYKFRGDRSLVTLTRFHPTWQTTIVELPSGRSSTTEAFLNRLVTTVDAAPMERVPAGEYVVLAPKESTASGTVKIFLGRNDVPIAQPSLDDLRNPHTPYTLRLPVLARTLNLRVESPTDGNRGISLQPVGVARPASRLPATRAAKYGHARAFFFDDWAYPEKDGFWTRANGSATVVIDTDEGTRLAGLPMSITAGAVPTSITVTVGSWEETFALTAGQKQDVTLPPASDGVWAVSLRSGAGFRPSERDPGSRDVRSLAAWIAIH